MLLGIIHMCEAADFNYVVEESLENCICAFEYRHLMWVSYVWLIPDPFNEVSVGTNIKSANQIDASLSATVLHQNPCRT